MKYIIRKLKQKILKKSFIFSLKAIRAKVWKARSDSPLFNCKMYAAGMEMLYKKMWERYARGEKPDHLAAIDKVDNQNDTTIS